MEMNKKVQPVNKEEQEEFFSGGAKELMTLLDYVEKRDNLVNEIRTASMEGKRLEKELEGLKEDIGKEAADSVKEELNKEVEKEVNIINTTSSKLKETKNKRGKAKYRGIKNRMSEETIELYNENKEIRRFIRKTLRENNLPVFCDTKWFYTIYCTQGIVELAVKLLVFALGLAVIPYIVVKIVNPWFILKALLWIVIAFVFVGVYVTIFLSSKDKDIGTLEEMRGYRENISDNNKKIREIKRNIKRDTDESAYGLESFDKSIEELEDTLEDAKRQRDTKIKVFESEKKSLIIEEIEEKYKEILTDKEDEIQKKVEFCKSKNEELLSVEEIIKTDYEKYLTKPYINAGCIRRMLELVEGGNVKDIGEAFEIVKQNIF